MKILKNIFLIAWTLWCLIGIVGNFSQYNFFDLIIIIPFVFMPYLIIWLVTYKINKRKVSNQNINEDADNINIPTNNDSSINISESIDDILPTDNLNNIETQTDIPLISSNQYIETANSIYCDNAKPISNEEVPYLIQVGYENALANEQQNTNPKFHRTAREEDLSFNFEIKYGYEVNYLTEKFEILYRDAYKTDDLSERIILLKEAVKAFEKAKKFCYSKGKGGTIYFQDMWEYMHNSQNQCYSYLDNIKNDLDETVFEKDIAIPGIINTISNNDGILQKNIYGLLPNIDKSTIQRIIKNLESDDKISRTKKGNSYELHLIKSETTPIPIGTSEEQNTIKKEYSFLPEEIETLDYIKNMLNINNVSYKKTSRYAYMHISDSQYKWICRIAVRQDNNLFTLHKFDNTDYETEYYFDDVEQLNQIQNIIIDTYQKCKSM